MKYLTKLRKKIKLMDAFGQSISLNFGNKGRRLNTILGGIVSILIYMIVLIYLGFRLYVLIYRTNSNISSVR